MELSNECLDKLLTEYDFNEVLDVGSGDNEHTKRFVEAGKQVISIDIGKSIYFKQRDPNVRVLQADYNNYQFSKTFDCIWCSHVLEHQLNVGSFLKKIFKDLKNDGVLAITVPPLNHEWHSPDVRLLGGHVSIWTAGLLLYNLVLAGFDCSDAKIKQYGYNLSLIVRKKQAIHPMTLSMDNQDVNKLIKYFPKCFEEGCDGDIRELNW